MNYLLDTNVCIALLNESSPQIEARVMKELRANSRLAVSSVSVFALWYGVAKSARYKSHTQKLATFLADGIDHLEIDEKDAQFAVGLRADLASISCPISDYDLLIASLALRHKMILITPTVREFRRIKALSWEDWSK